MSLASLPRLMIEPAVRPALLEDLGLAGDITSTAVIPASHRSKLVSSGDGRECGHVHQDAARLHKRRGRMP